MNKIRNYLNTLFYINYKALGRIMYLNMIKYFSLRRFIFTLLFALAIHVVNVFMAIGRILDDILFPAHRNYELNHPIFIISNPRCGTTYLHRLLDSDTQFCSTLLYQTILTSVTYIRLVRLFGKLDDKVGSPMHKIVNLIDKAMFGGWDGIHNTGFLQTEEDEAVFALIAFTPALTLVSPFSTEIEELNYLDKLNEKTKEKIKRYYRSTLNRVFFAIDPHKRPIIKNVFSSGRIKFIQECFPDAQIIYPYRDPKESIPSVISMFSKGWNMHSKKYIKSVPHLHAFGLVAADYYNYMYEIVTTHRNVTIIDYEELKTDPQKVLQFIYSWLGIRKDTQPMLKKSNQRFRTAYVSKHTYCLEQYGFSENMIQQLIPRNLDTKKAS